MNSIASHVEYLLRKHDCVVLPGLGALLCRYVPASFADEDGVTLNPPGRFMAFNGMLTESDGMLASSVARQSGVTFEAATRSVEAEVAQMRAQLALHGELQLGRLGKFISSADGLISFEPDEIAGINGYFFGLRPISLRPFAMLHRPAAAKVAEPVLPVYQPEPRSRHSWRAYAAGIAASLALLFTVGLYCLSPMSINTPTDTASLAPAVQVKKSTQTKPITIKKNQQLQVRQQIKGVPVRRAVSTDSVRMIKGGQKVTPGQPVKNSQNVKPVKPNGAVKAGKAEIVELPKQLDYKAKQVGTKVKPTSSVQPRLSASDRYCVIVASFATRSQAEAYVAQNGGSNLGILEKDDKFRVYGATGSTRDEANAQRALTGKADAWVCAR